MTSQSHGEISPSDSSVGSFRCPTGTVLRVVQTKTQAGSGLRPMAPGHFAVATCVGLSRFRRGRGAVRHRRRLGHRRDEPAQLSPHQARWCRRGRGHRRGHGGAGAARRPRPWCGPWRSGPSAATPSIRRAPSTRRWSTTRSLALRHDPVPLRRRAPVLGRAGRRRGHALDPGRPRPVVGQPGLRPDRIVATYNQPLDTPAAADEVGITTSTPHRILRWAVRLAAVADLVAERLADVVLVVTELASNALDHGTGPRRLQPGVPTPRWSSNP